MPELLARLRGSVTLDGEVVDLRVGTHWTALVVATGAGERAGFAATQVAHSQDHGTPAVREAGQLLGRRASTFLDWTAAPSLTERSIAFAALNALLEVDEARCREQNAEELILEWGRGKKVAIVGHFPFVPGVAAIASRCAVLELNPGPTDLPASAAPDVLPDSDVVAITGMTLVNGTFEALAALCRPDARVLLLGASAPLTPVLFDYGVEAISGTVVTDIAPALVAISQGANFRQIPGKRLLTMMKA